MIDTVICGSVFDKLPEIPTGSVNCCVTSPPYWGLRDYGVEGQLGLEKTPEEYIAKMVEVFREVWRVLRDDGTLWLNLGDSYVGSGKGGGGCFENMCKSHRRDTTIMPRQNKGVAGLKPKDLCGIPWRVAFALQQPYYTGTIKDERDRLWLAAMIDTEGCMFIHKRKVGQSNGQGYKRKNANYAPGLEIANTSKAIVDRCMAIVGKGSICSQSPEQNKRRKQTIYRWNLRTTECRDIVREIYPHLTAKHHQARLLCGCPSSGPDADAAHQSLMALHNGNDATIDFPVPASMFEPGWYLRQDIIWKKPNPMPESVRDRCTKAHEYIFLMTKKPRYYYDAEAIREGEQIYTRKAGGYKNHKEQMIDGYSPFKGKGGFADCDITTVGRNKRSVWTVPTAPYSEAHFATFPPDLILPCILAGCPQQVCKKCGEPRQRIVDVSYEKQGKGTVGGRGRFAADDNSGFTGKPNMRKMVDTTGWTDCGCGAGFDGGIVLDPFMGSGTVGLVAYQNNRHYIGIELNPEYCKLGRIQEERAKYALFAEEQK